MHDNFLSIQKIEDVAKAASMSEYHFYRSFKQVYGYSTYQYLTLLRLQLAKQLLEEGTEKVKIIAKKCLFPDQFTFSKAFKRWYEVSPSEYREKDRGR